MTERRILVCYDGSQRVLDRTTEIARAVPSRVTVISVAEPLYREPPYSGWADPEEERAHRRLLDDATRTLLQSGVAASALEPVGDTVDMIDQAARVTSAELIVVGTSHRRILRRLGACSISGKLAADAPCDVLVVR